MSSAQPNPTGPPPPPLVRPVEIPGRGRSLIAAGPIKPGQIVLYDSPLLLYPSALPSFCSCCFRVLPSQPFPCSSCHVALFCSARCLSLSHPPLLCRALPALVSVPASSPDLLFLLSAYSLPESSLLQLFSLHSNSDLGNEANDAARVLHSQLCSLIPPDLIPMRFSPETTAALVSKEKVNSFCLMNPISLNNGDCEVTGVRAYGIYLSASLFNHDCLPNVCRFDYIDDPNRENNTDFAFRALHDIAEGSEVCISYLRVTRGYRDRQKMLMQDYGFKCECDRCKIESQWKENQGDEEDAGDENDGDEMEEMEGEDDEEGEMELEGNGEEDDENFPHQYFFLRYVCECGGTLAPLPPSHEGVLSDFVECNLCGMVRKDEFSNAGGV